MLEFSISQVEQFQVMTRCRVWPQEWAAERTEREGPWEGEPAGSGWGLSVGTLKHPFWGWREKLHQARCGSAH
jgi:hypothetical protein